MSSRKRPARTPLVGTVVPYKSVYLVFVDHSIIGAWPTKRRARTAMRVLLSESLLKLTFLIAGPYVLRARAR